MGLRSRLVLLLASAVLLTSEMEQQVWQLEGSGREGGMINISEMPAPWCWGHPLRLRLLPFSQHCSQEQAGSPSFLWDIGLAVWVAFRFDTVALAGLDSERIAKLAVEGGRAGGRRLSMKLAVPLAGCVTLSESLRLPEAAAKCREVKSADCGCCVLFFVGLPPTLYLSLFGWLLQQSTTDRVAHKQQNGLPLVPEAGSPRSGRPHGQVLCP